MKDLNFKQIGNNIRTQRKKMGMTQEAVAEKLDVNPSHISNIERGAVKASLGILVSMANIFSCSLDCFISHEYVFDPISNSEPEANAWEQLIIKKIRSCSDEKKERILKIIDLL